MHPNDLFFLSAGDKESFDYNVNPVFQNWVQETFMVSIPKKGSEIVKIHDETFLGWLRENSKFPNQF